MIIGKISTRAVSIDGKDLSPARSQKVYNHSPDGFNWGNYGGSGPSQLALAVMLELVDEATAVRLYQRFKWDFIAKLPNTDFTLDEQQVKDWIAKRNEQDAAGESEPCRMRDPMASKALKSQLKEEA